MSFKAELRISLKGFSVVCPIRYEKLSNETERQKQETFLKVGDNVVEKRFEIFASHPIKIDVKGDGKLVSFQQGDPITDYMNRKKVITNEARDTIFQEAEIKEFQIVDEKEVEVEKDSETSKVFEIVDTRPIDIYSEYIFDKEYEVFSDKKKTKRGEITYESELLKVVEYLYDNKVLGVFQYQRGGLNWAGILKPIMTNGNGKKNYFTALMGLTMTVKQYQHLYEVEIARNKIANAEPIKKKLATLNV